MAPYVRLFTGYIWISFAHRVCVCSFCVCRLKMCLFRGRFRLPDSRLTLGGVKVGMVLHKLMCKYHSNFTVSTVVITSFFLPFVHVFDASTADVRPWRVGSAMTADLSKNGIDRLLLVHLPKLNVYQGSRPPGRWSRGYGVLWRMGWRETAPPSS